MDELRTLLSGLAIIISGFSIYFTRKLWFLSNRPIITAIIEDFSLSSLSVTFNLVVYNSGNRPATNIVLETNKDVLQSIFDDYIDEKTMEITKMIFSKESEIPILINGQYIETAFGFYDKEKRNCIKFGSTLPITIKYSDLDGKNYTSSLKLLFKGKKGFGGSFWQSTLVKK